MSEWTKGPWRTGPDLENCGGGSNVAAPGKDGRRQLRVAHTAEVKYGGQVFIDVEEALANARLIAAAPELVEVLEGLTKFESGHEEYHCEKHDVCVCGYNEALGKAKALLARVRGEEEREEKGR